MSKPIVTKTTEVDAKALTNDSIRKFMLVYVDSVLVEAFEVYSLAKRAIKIKEMFEKYAGKGDIQIKHKNIPDEYKLLNQCPEGVCPVRLEKEETVTPESDETVPLDIETGEKKVVEKATKTKKTNKKAK